LGAVPLTALSQSDIVLFGQGYSYSYSYDPTCTTRDPVYGLPDKNIARISTDGIVVNSWLCFACRRERQVMDSMPEGKSSKEIAVLLNMSVRTVEYHRAKVMWKIGMSTLVELLRAWITRNGAAIWIASAWSRITRHCAASGFVSCATAGTGTCDQIQAELQGA
jgi:DNA-binding CsgD family transcriptional regulator